MAKIKSKVKTFFGKVKSFLSTQKDKVMMAAAFPASALTLEGTGTAGVDASSLTEQITGMFSDFSVSNLVIIIGAALGIGVVLFLFWFAYRFIKRQAVKGITKGKL